MKTKDKDREKAEDSDSSSSSSLSSLEEDDDVRGKKPKEEEMKKKTAVKKNRTEMSEHKAKAGKVNNEAANFTTKKGCAIRPITLYFDNFGHFHNNNIYRDIYIML